MSRFSLYANGRLIESSEKDDAGEQRIGDGVVLLTVAPNIHAEPIRVAHASLEKWSEDSAFKAHCPTCKDGLLLVHRDQSTLRIQREDRCISCAQRFIYTDNEIGGERLPLGAGATEDEEEAALEARYCSCEEFAPGTATCPETRVPLCAACGLWRPEWIKCVQVGDEAFRAATVDTVCGRLRVFGEFTFINWEHADVNEAHQGRLTTCAACKAARVPTTESK